MFFVLRAILYSFDIFLIEFAIMNVGADGRIILKWFLGCEVDLTGSVIVK
jgi:hypothetical protein